MTQLESCVLQCLALALTGHEREFTCELYALAGHSKSNNARGRTEDGGGREVALRNQSNTCVRAKGGIHTQCHNTAVLDVRTEHYQGKKRSYNDSTFLIDNVCSKNDVIAPCWRLISSIAPCWRLISSRVILCPTASALATSTRGRQAIL